MNPYYQKDGITIYHGDCLEIMPGLGKVDAVVTDPPYGMNLGSHGGANDKRARELRRGGYASYEDTPDNYQEKVVPAIARALGMSNRGAVFGPAPSIWGLPVPDALGGVFIPAACGRSPWGFQNLAPVCFYGVAPDLNLGAKNTTIRASGRSDPESGHPCPKPLPWMVWVIDLASRPGETILDPFLGSGTTLVACRKLGREGIGIEIEEKYCEIAARRLEAFDSGVPLKEARAGQRALWG